MTLAHEYPGHRPIVILMVRFLPYGDSIQGDFDSYSADRWQLGTNMTGLTHQSNFMQVLNTS